MIELNVYSETSFLENVLIHSPGFEVENMSPSTAKRALYSDILNLSVASREYLQFKKVLEKVCQVLELKQVLCEVMDKKEARHFLLEQLFRKHQAQYVMESLLTVPSEDLAQQLIEGIPHPRLSLTHFLHSDSYLASPLHNALFTRDPAFIIGNNAIISTMANPIRQPESILMHTLFRFHPEISCGVIELEDTPYPSHPFTIEGGDIHLLNPNCLLVGISQRTTPRAIDSLIRYLASSTCIQHILLQELPGNPESFIHLDMVFTLLSDTECLIYKPLLLDDTRYHSLHLEIRDKEIYKIRYLDNLLHGFKKLGYSLDAIPCGGKNSNHQEREQWHSGANLFAFAPGKVIGFERNTHTLDALQKTGYRIVPAQQFINQPYQADSPEKLLVSVEGSELARGGGGPRCMTLPLRRK